MSLVVPVRPFLSCACVLGLALMARADVPAPAATTPTIAQAGVLPAQLGAAAPTPAPVSRAQFFNALGDQVSFVGALRSWRDTLRGSGSAPRRQLWNSSAAGGTLALSLGQVQAPGLAGFNGGAGTSVSWRGKGGQSFDAGTTARPAALDEMLQHFDAVTSGTPGAKPAPANDSDVTWLRAKPLSNSGAEVEATLLRAAREGQAQTAKSGTFAGVNGRLALVSNWMLRGAWTSAQFDGQSERTSWNAQANGLLSHPWGQADVSLDWKTTDAGFATFSGANASGESEGNAQITQKIATPLVSGTLVAATSTHARESLDGVKASDELSRDSARGSADLRAQLMPHVALSATANVSQVGVERAASAPDPVANPTRELLLSTVGDVGLDWQVSKQLAIGAGAGLSQTQDNAATGASSTMENRAALRLRFARASENYALALQTRDRDTAGQTDARWAHLTALQLNAERPLPLLCDWRLKTSASWMLDRAASSGDPNGVARQISAGLQFARAASLDVRYRDGAALPSNLSNDPMGAAFSSSGFAAGNREIATRFNFGSASGGNGLGLAVEWARKGAASSPNDSWKIGLTYR